MNTTANEVLEFVRENDIKFIRLSFSDILGRQKNISIMADQLEGAFKSGISFDASAVRGFNDVTKSDLFLFPEPETLAVLPWRPTPGRVARFYCEIKNPDGSVFLNDGRALLKRVSKRAEGMGYKCKIGSECEFYLFKTDENNEPTDVPFDKGGYLDISPLDRGEDIRREICLTLEEMGIKPESSHHEQGPGQNEIDFQFNDAVNSADNLQTFKSVVKSVATRGGLYASFMPKPLSDYAGSGMHINISILKNMAEVHSKTAESFIAGILKRTPEMTLFLNPIANSYERFGKFEAPKYVSWSHQNRSQLIRIPAAAGNKMRIELRSPDPSLNPYLAFALVISAGLDGIENDFPLPPAVNKDLYAPEDAEMKALKKLPKDLSEAVTLAENSEFATNILGRDLLLAYIELKKKELSENLPKEHYFKFI